MQTFLPSKSFVQTAEALDYRRLGKQRVETMQIMKAFTRASGGWVNHPAVKMWRGFGWALLEYQRAVCGEWVSGRGFKDTCMDKTIEIYNALPAHLKNEGVYPPWMSRDEIYEAHRSMLIQKKPDHYQPLWPETPTNLEYVWPV